MGEGKHTCGTWAVGHAGFERKPVVVARRAGRPVTVAVFDSGNREEDEANARLIAAAPEMLEALKLAATYMERDEGRPGNAHDAMVRGHIEQVQSAIAKAEGR